MKIDFTWTLKFLAEVSYATSKWENPEIKAKVIQICSSLDDEGEKSMQEELADISKIVVENVRKDNLPESISVKIFYIVEQMGGKIFYWAKSISKQFYLKIDNTDAIHWTSIGTIDQVKVFQKWISTKEINPECVCNLYFMACRFVQLGYLKTHFVEIEQVLDLFNEWSLELMLGTLLTINICDEDFKKKWNLVDCNIESKFIHLFCTAVTYGYHIAVKYYWGKMTLQDQRDNLMPRAQEYVRQCYKRLGFSLLDDSKLSREEVLEILIFLMSKMSKKQTVEFYSDNKVEILMMFLSIWPAQNLFIPMLEKVNELLTKSDYCTILRGILYYVEKNDKMRFISSHEDFYGEVFDIVWHTIPTSIKIELVLNEKTPSFHFVIKMLFDKFLFQKLILIINDKDIKCVRDNVINFYFLNKKYYDELVFFEKFEVLNHFMEHVFHLDQEKKKFKLELNFFDDRIKEGNFNAASNFLKWQLGPNWPELRNKRIDIKKMCLEWIAKNKYDESEKFLRCVFPNEVDKENFKDIFRADDFVAEKIKNIMKSDGKNWLNKKRDVFEFLKWVFNFEKENEKEEYVIKIKKWVRFFCNKLRYYNLQIEEFLDFCQVPENKFADMFRLMDIKN